MDRQVAAILRHQGGKLGIVKAALRVGMTCTARVSGSEGVIDIPALVPVPTPLLLHGAPVSSRIDGSYEGNGLGLEIEEMRARRLRGRGDREPHDAARRDDCPGLYPRRHQGTDRLGLSRRMWRQQGCENRSMFNRYVDPAGVAQSTT